MTTAQDVAPPRRAGLGALGERLPSLTGMRALAGLSVFLTHAIALSAFADPEVSANYILYLANTGSFGVAFFFVLTGFVVTWSARPGDRAALFWRRRFFKLYPSHIVVSLIILILLLISGAPVEWLQALASFVLVQAWVPDVNYLLYAVNGPTWSLNIDVAAYAAFPLLYLLIRRIRPERLWWWAVGVMALAVVLPYLARVILPDSPPSLFSPTVSWPQHWFGFYFPITRLIEFVVGILMARIVLAGRWIGFGVAPAALLTLAVHLATLRVSIFDGYTFIPLIPIALLVAAVAASDVSGRRTILNSAAMVWLGERMYSFFLIHITVMFSVHALFSHEWGVSGFYHPKAFGTVQAFGLLIGLFLLCLVLASVLYALVERPVMRRWSRPRRTGAPGATSSINQPYQS